MRKIKSITLVILLALALIPTTIPLIPTVSAATAYTEINGTLNGANYSLRIPNPIEAWTGGLVIYCHGYSHTEPARPLIKASDGSSGWANGILSVGSAFAMSSYGAGGYCVKKGMNATYELTQYLMSTYEIHTITLVGVSMGGNIALLLAEKYPNVYSGVMDISGAKNITAFYNQGAILATANETFLTEYLQNLTAPLPPYPFNLVVPPPLSNQLGAYRAFVAQAVADIAVECGGTPNVVPEAYQNIDPLYHANISIPIITVHGTSDAIVPYWASLQYQAAVAAAGKSIMYRLYTVVGGEHATAAVHNVAASHFPELVTWIIGHPLLQATAFSNVTVLTGWTWWFFAHAAGGSGKAFTFQWFEGATLLQGQTSMVLAITKNIPGTYAYFCKVTDSAGAAVNSNAVYLTVR